VKHMYLLDSVSELQGKLELRSSAPGLWSLWRSMQGLASDRLINVQAIHTFCCVRAAAVVALLWAQLSFDGGSVLLCIYSQSAPNDLAFRSFSSVNGQ